MLVKISPINQRAKNRIKEHGSFFLIKRVEESPERILVEPSYECYDKRKWLGWFNQTEATWVKACDVDDLSEFYPIIREMVFVEKKLNDKLSLVECLSHVVTKCVLDIDILATEIKNDKSLLEAIEQESIKLNMLKERPQKHFSLSDLF